VTMYTHTPFPAFSIQNSLRSPTFPNFAHPKSVRFAYTPSGARDSLTASSGSIARAFGLRSSRQLESKLRRLLIRGGRNCVAFFTRGSIHLFPLLLFGLWQLLLVKLSYHFSLLSFFHLTPGALYYGIYTLRCAGAAS